MDVVMQKNTRLNQCCVKKKNHFVIEGNAIKFGSIKLEEESCVNESVEVRRTPETRAFGCI